AGGGWRRAASGSPVIVCSNGGRRCAAPFAFSRGCPAAPFFCPRACSLSQGWVPTRGDRRSASAPSAHATCPAPASLGAGGTGPRRIGAPVPADPLLEGETRRALLLIAA